MATVCALLARAARPSYASFFTQASDSSSTALQQLKRQRSENTLDPKRVSKRRKRSLRPLNLFRIPGRDRLHSEFSNEEIPSLYEGLSLEERVQHHAYMRLQLTYYQFLAVWYSNKEQELLRTDYQHGVAEQEGYRAAHSALLPSLSGLDPSWNIFQAANSTVLVPELVDRCDQVIEDYMRPVALELANKVAFGLHPYKALNCLHRDIQEHIKRVEIATNKRIVLADAILEASEEGEAIESLWEDYKNLSPYSVFVAVKRMGQELRSGSTDLLVEEKTLMERSLEVLALQKKGSSLPPFEFLSGRSGVPFTYKELRQQQKKLQKTYFHIKTPL